MLQNYDKQMTKMPKKGEYVRFKNYETKVKSSFVIYTDFQIILVAEDNGKQSPDESFAKKYQYVA